MKKATLLLLLALAFAGCKKHETSEKENGGKPPVEEPPVKYETVNIGGTEWMLYNLANPRQAEGGATFATKLPSECTGTRLESHGKLYQWGVNVAWSSMGESINGATPDGKWNTSEWPSDWTDQPCPKGYRLPTDKEIKNLYNTTTVSNGGGWSEDDYGYKIFTFNDDSSKSLEFPAVGYRDGAGKLYAAGTWGYYWSSVEHSSVSAYHLLFDQSGAGPQAGSNKELGHNIRCVKGTDDPDTDDSDNTDDTEGPDDPDNPGNANPNPVDPDEKIDPFSTIEIAGTEWMPLNLANPREAPGGATFATKLPSQCSGIRAESHGKFYQWGINVAWNTTGKEPTGATPDGEWIHYASYAFSWADHPCPEGYRLPGHQEFQNLYNSSIISNGGGWSEDDYGYTIFIHKNDYSKRLEFPAVGYRNYSDGTLHLAGQRGYYWSSVAYTSNTNGAYYMYFHSSDLLVDWYLKQDGYSVRCVRQ